MSRCKEGGCNCNPRRQLCTKSAAGERELNRCTVGMKKDGLLQIEIGEDNFRDPIASMKRARNLTCNNERFLGWVVWSIWIAAEV